MALCTVVNLPLEIHLQIFTHLSAQDIVYFLSTCRGFYTAIKTETIWRNLSSRYGLTDLSIFGNPDFTFHLIYTRFLHTYGPLLGLWASDHPFRGNVLEFRFLTKDEYVGLGIIGEVWRFPAALLAQDNMDPVERDKPAYPLYWESIWIILSSTHGDQGGHSSVNFHYTPSLLFSQYGGGTNTGKASLNLLSETTQSYFIWYGAGVAESAHSLHPEFPASESDVWYDRARGLPRLRKTRTQLYDNSATMPRIANAVSVYGAPTENVKPPALSLSSGPRSPDLHHPPFLGIAELRGAGHWPLEEPVFGMRDMDDPCGRYYPLRFPTLPVQPDYHPQDENRTGESLTGLWLGAYGLFGTEVLFLEWVEEENVVRAWKITGDVHVPRGVISWTFKVDAPVELDARSQEAFGELPPQTRAYVGSGFLSGRGYIPSVRETRRVVVAIVDKDELRIRWGGTRRGPRVVRYKPRDVASESVLHTGVRRHSSQS